MDILEGFGKQVRARRELIGVSQEKFAAKCKLDRTYISGIERGKRNLSLRNIKLIADALDTTISELMKGL